MLISIFQFQSTVDFIIPVTLNLICKNGMQLDRISFHTCKCFMQGFIIKLIPEKHLYRSQDRCYLILNYMNVKKGSYSMEKLHKSLFLNFLLCLCATVARELWSYVLHLVGVQEVGGKRGAL